MSLSQRSDLKVAAYLDEGPRELPDASRKAILAALPVTGQTRRGWLAGHRGRLEGRGTRFARLAFAAAVVTVALAVLSLLRPGVDGGTGGRPAPGDVPPAVVGASASPLSSVTSRPAPSPLPAGTPSPLVGRADEFVVPFAYALPAGAGLEVDASSTLYQFRHPAPDGENFDWGVVVRAAPGGRADPCRERSVPQTLADSSAFIRYLRTVPTMTVSDVTRTTVDGHHAMRAHLAFDPPTASCPDIWLWSDDGSITQNGSRAPVDITMVDIAGQHLAILAFGSVPSAADAAQLIDSLRFGPPGPSASP